MLNEPVFMTWMDVKYLKLRKIKLSMTIFNTKFEQASKTSDVTTNQKFA